MKKAVISLGLMRVVASSLNAEIVPQDDSYTMQPGSTLWANGLNGNPVGLLANDTGALQDGSENPVVINPPQNGTVNIGEDGTFTYVPSPNFQGTDQFTYEIDLAPGTVAIDSSSTWRARFNHPTLPPDRADPDFDQTWTTDDFDDSDWLPATGLIGYGFFDGVDTITLDTPLDFPPSGLAYGGYLRSSFNLSSAVHYRVEVSAARDDAAIIYIGGQELGRLTGQAAFAVSTWPDDFYLSVEGKNDAWASGVDEFRSFSLSGYRDLEAGLHTVAVSLHNALGSDRISLASSDLTFGMESLRLTPVAAATVNIVVAGAAPTPSVTHDWFRIAPNTVYSSLAEARSLYDNDGLLNEMGNPYFQIQNLTIDDEVSAGSVSSSDPATGQFTFIPTPGFVGQTQFSYQVSTEGGTSLTGNVILEITADAVLGSSVVRVIAPGPDPISLGVPSDNFSRFLSVPGSGIVRTVRGEATATVTYQTDASPQVGMREFSVMTQSNPLSETRAIIESYTPWPSPWRYFHPLDGVDPAVGDPDFHTTWFTTTYDDQAWSSGSGLFGYGDLQRQIGVDIGQPAKGDRLTAYFRYRFGLLADDLPLPGLLLKLASDDGAIIYLNGKEVARSPDYFTGSDNYELLAPPGPFSFGNAAHIIIPSDNLIAGRNVLAISVHNSSSSNGDLGMRCEGLFAGTGIRSTIPIKFEVVSPMRVWLEKYFDQTEVMNPLIGGMNADTDLDSHSNLVEYIHDTDPSDPKSKPNVSAGVSIIDQGGDLSAVPTFENLPSGIPKDTLIEVQVSNDLTHWWTAGAQYGGLSYQWFTPAGVSESPVDTLSFPLDAETLPRFFRVQYHLAPWVTDVAGRTEP